MAVPTLMFSILSQIMPPMTRLFRFFFDCYFYFITKSLIMPLERLPQIRQVQEE